MQTAAEEQIPHGRGLFVRGMRLVGSYVRAHPRPFLTSVAGAFLFALASIGLTAVLGRVTDQVLAPAFSGGVAASTVWLGNSLEPRRRRRIRRRGLSDSSPRDK